jgi:hypothetical protein
LLYIPSFGCSEEDEGGRREREMERERERKEREKREREKRERNKVGGERRYCSTLLFNSFLV